MLLLRWVWAAVSHLHRSVLPNLREESRDYPLTPHAGCYRAMSARAAATTASGVIPSSRAIVGAGAEAP